MSDTLFTSLAGIPALAGTPVLAQAGFPDWIFPAVAGFMIVAFVVAVLLFAFVLRIAKAGPNEVLVISGSKGRTRRMDGAMDRLGFRLVKGGTTWYFPLLNKLDRMSLELITLDVQTPPVYTSQGVPIVVDGIAQIKIKGDDVSMATAAEQFLSKTKQEIQRIALQTVEGHLRAILGTMTVEEVYSNRETFAQKVQEVAAGDLANMGLAVVSFTIRDIRDEHGYLEALGKPRIAQVRRDATLGEAYANRDAEIGKNQATADAIVKSADFKRQSEAARYAAEAEIAASKASADAAMGATKFQAEAQIAEQERNYQVKLAEYTAGVNKSKAEAELAYDLQRNITAQKVKEQEIQIQVIEKEKQLQVQQQEILRKEKELEATILKPALAEQQRIQTLANAEKYQLEITAQGASESAKLRGFADAEIEKAQSEARKVAGLIDAQISEARGRAEAEAIRARGLAEAEVALKAGESAAEAMRLKAQAWQEYNSAAILQLLIEKLPEMARAIAEPLSKTEKIVMINHGGGNGSGGGMASQITKEVTDIMTQLPPVLEALTGMDMQELMAKLPALRETPNGHSNGDGPKDKKPVVKPATPEPPLK